MKTLRAEEEWARRIIEAELSATVRQHDDGSLPGMHDLEIAYSNGRTAAVEVTSAGDSEAIEWWRLANGSGGRWIVEGIQGGWAVVAEPSSRIKLLRTELPKLLLALESQLIKSIDVRDWRSGDRPEVNYARQLGIVHAFQSGTEYPGSTYLTVQLPLERSGGFVSDSSDAVVEWVGDFLRDPSQQDVITKLLRSETDERHAFVILPGFTTAPFSVSSLFMDSKTPLPYESPVLPTPLTDVWIVSTWATGDGFRWSSKSGWRRFRKFDGQ